MLFRKLWRTMGQYKAQFISMILMIALGIGVFVGFNMEWKSIEINTERFYEETGFADYRIYKTSGFSAEDLEKISATEGTEKAGRFVSFNAILNDNGKKTLAVAVTENPEVSFAKIVSGEEYDENSENGVWVSDRFAEKNNLKTGDEITLGYSGITVKAVIKGLAKSSEYLICTRDESQLMPDYETYGFAYVSPAAYAKATDSAIKEEIAEKLFAADESSEEEKAQKKANGVYAAQAEAAFMAEYPSGKSGKEIYAQINVISSAEKKEFKEKVNAVLGATTLVLGKEETISYSGPQGETEEGKTMGSVLPVMFLLIAVLTMVTTMHRLTAKEKTQIGTLKALGFKDKRITAHYTSYALMIGLIGSVSGAALGYGIAYYIMNPNGMMGTYLDMPYWNLSMPWFCYVIVAGIIGLLTFIGFLSVKQMLKGTAADALRPYSPKKVKKLAIEKTRLWKKFSFGTKWNLRDVMRHKSRTFMSLFGIIGCTILLVGSLGMNDTMQSFLRDYYGGAMNYSSRIYVADNSDADETYAFKIIEKYNGDYSGSVAAEIEDKTVSLDVYSVTHDRVRFPAKGSGFVTIGDDGAYVCERISREFKLKAGDELTISPFGENKVYTLKIAGIIRSVTESITITPVYAQKLGIKYSIDSVYTDVDKADIEAEAKTDNLLKNNIKSVQSRGDIIKSFDTFTELLKSSVTVLIAAAIVLGLVVLYNLGVMSYTERYREMATLKVVGFNDKKIGGLLIGQNLWITLLGVLLGVPLGVGVLSYLVVALASEYEMTVAVSALTIVISVLLAFAVSFFVSLAVAKKNKKINMVEALKFAE